MPQGAVIVDNKTGFLQYGGSGEYWRVGSYGYGNGVGGTGVEHYCTLAVAEGEFGTEHPVLEFVYEHLFQLHAKGMGEAHKEVVGERSWRIYAFDFDCNRLSLGGTDYYRNAVWSAFLGQQQCESSAVQLAVAYAHHI